MSSRNSRPHNPRPRTRAAATQRPATRTAEEVSALSEHDLNDLVEAANSAILSDGGFGWLRPPPRAVMQQYWRGVLLIPETRLFVVRLDGVICGALQLRFRPANNEAQRLVGRLTTFFIAPWARGRGLGGALLETVENTARRAGLHALELDLRETQKRAQHAFESRGYRKWGVNPHYARTRDGWVRGHYYTLLLRPENAPPAPAKNAPGARANRRTRGRAPQ